MASKRGKVQARPRSPSWREQLPAIWAGVKRTFAWIVRLSLIAALLLAIVWVGQIFWQRLQTPLAHVVVDGANAKVPAKWVRARMSPLKGTDFWQADLRTVQKRLLDNPWVAQADLQRRWPDTLVVRLDVHRPIARWQGDRLLDDKGQTFRPPPATMPNDLPVLNGPDGRAWPLWERYLTLKPVLAGVGLKLIGVLENSRGSQELLLEHGCLLRLGKEQIETRLQRFLDVYAKTLAGKMNKVAAIDLRYTNGFAVKWRDGADDGNGKNLKKSDTEPKR